MTLEEAKKKIEELGEDAWNKWKKEGNLISQGYALGMDDALGALDKVESSGNPEQLTLTELARELRRIFRFKWLTISIRTNLHLWVGQRPNYYKNGHFWSSDFIKTSLVGSLSNNCLNVSLDLSEYADENGEIDYSRCIVEVSDDAE